MRRARSVIAATLTVLAAPLAWGQLAPAKKPPTEGQKILDIINRNRGNLVKGPDIAYTILPEETIFPSLVIASATMKVDEASRPETLLGDLRGNIGIGISSISEYTAIKVTISCDEIMEPSTFDGFLPKAKVTYAIMPKIKWKYDALLKRRQQMPVEISFKVKLGILKEVEHVVTCTLRSINDCPLAFAAGPVEVDTRWAFAAYVNEDHPWVDGILKEAIETHVVSAFTGYQTTKDQAILRQIYAVWRVLQTRGISYSDISRVSAQNETLLSQHVRFLDECITNKQANCIDGTVMLASVLTKIGLNCSIVCVPGHAFLAIDLDREGNETLGLETTMLGRDVTATDARTQALHDILAKQAGFHEKSWNSFAAAIKIGTERLITETPKLSGQEAASMDYGLISIGDARALGVRPIPYSDPAASASKTPPVTPAPRILRRIR